MKTNIFSKLFAYKPRLNKKWSFIIKSEDRKQNIYIFSNERGPTLFNNIFSNLISLLMLFN